MSDPKEYNRRLHRGAAVEDHDGSNEKARTNISQLVAKEGESYRMKKKAKPISTSIDLNKTTQTRALEWENIFTFERGKKWGAPTPTYSTTCLI